jgi:phytoene dehydrogenase-like protein
MNSIKKIIIIGSGLGGLVAGNLLAQKGHKVTIMESHSSPGGYTAGFRRMGYYFESGTLSLESSPTVFRAMKEIGVLDKIEFVRQRTRTVSPRSDNIIESYDDFKKILYSGFKSENKNLDRYFREVDIINRIIGGSEKPIPYVLKGFPYFVSMLSFMLKIIINMKVIKQYNDMTIDEFTEKFFTKNTALYNILKNIGYPQMNALLIGGAFISMIDDYWTVKGGMQSWADALADNFTRYGGELQLKSLVSKIITKEGTVSGVVSNNNEYPADYVIAACDYKKTFLNLLDDTSLIGAERLEKIRNAQVSEGIFTVYLGLNISNEELKKYMKIPHVIFNNSKDTADINDPDDIDYFRKTGGVVLYSPSLVNPDLAPDGKSSLMLQTFSPQNWMKNWGDGDKKKYLGLKERAKRTLIEKAGGIIPDLEKNIEFEDAATPLTYERYTHNSNGATSSWSWNPRKRFYGRTFMSYVDTPVKNLYIGSCWASQIGGIPGAISAAYLCAKKIEKK